jgi:hypothetical protein
LQSSLESSMDDHMKDFKNKIKSCYTNFDYSSMEMKSFPNWNSLYLNLQEQNVQ